MLAWVLFSFTLELTGLAVVQVGLTVASGEARSAGALVAAQSVLAACSVAAWILHTLFNVHLAGLALGRANAEETSKLV